MSTHESLLVVSRLRLRCLLDGHLWRNAHDNSGQELHVCERCRKERYRCPAHPYGQSRAISVMYAECRCPSEPRVVEFDS